MEPCPVTADQTLGHSLRKSLSSSRKQTCDDLKQQKQLHHLISHKLLPVKGTFQNPPPRLLQIYPSWESIGGSTGHRALLQEMPATSIVTCQMWDQGMDEGANHDMSDTSQRCPSGFRCASRSYYRGSGNHNQCCIHIIIPTFPAHGVRYIKVWEATNPTQQMDFTLITTTET